MESFAPAPEPAANLAEGEQRLLEALRQGDDSAFEALVLKYHSSLLRLARVYVGSHSAAEDVTQETWVGVLRGIRSFEGRSSLKTWIFQILVNRARTRAARETRTVPAGLPGAGESEVPQDRFMNPGHPNWRPEWHRHWALPPASWGNSPEKELLAEEAKALLLRTLDRLPALERSVITMRDIEEWPAQEVCNVLELSETYQRVLLHRARAKVRNALERYFANTGKTSSSGARI